MAPRRAPLGLCVVAAAVACAPVNSSTEPVTTQWGLVWRDEFTGPAGSQIDSAKWQYDTADGCASSNCGWGNNEKEYYARAAGSIALNGQGQLMIVARTAPPGLACYYGPCRYTSAKIATRGKMDVRYGRVEARIQLAAGQGLWPAFWMLGNDIGTAGWPGSGELDIMENRGSAPDKASSAIHGPGYSGNTPLVHVHTFTTGSVASAFHNYAVEWDSSAIRFFVDDTVHYVANRADVERYGKWVFDHPFFVILNQAVGGHFDGDPQSDAIFPATMLIDYVRVYRKAGAK